MNARQASSMYEDLISTGMTSEQASTFVDDQLEAQYREYKAQKAERRIQKIEENIAWCIQSIAKLTAMVSEMKSALAAATTNAPTSNGS